MNKTHLDKIVDWNEERGLIKTPQDLKIENDMSFIIEEVLEAMTNLQSSDARPLARIISDVIIKGNLQELCNIAEEKELNQGPNKIEPTEDQMVDACGDIIVFATGTIRKAGYSPNIVMNEVIQEIESRRGSIIDGKFTKDKSPEAQALWYKASFEKAKV